MELLSSSCREDGGLPWLGESRPVKLAQRNELRVLSRRFSYEWTRIRGTRRAPTRFLVGGRGRLSEVCKEDGALKVEGLIVGNEGLTVCEHLTANRLIESRRHLGLRLGRWG